MQDTKQPSKIGFYLCNMFANLNSKIEITIKKKKQKTNFWESEVSQRVYMLSNIPDP